MAIAIIFQMHFVVFVLVVNVFLAWNVSGEKRECLTDTMRLDGMWQKIFSGQKEAREDHSADKYDENYDKFLERHFGHSENKHLDKKAEYKQAQEDAKDDGGDDDYSDEGSDDEEEHDGKSNDDPKKDAYDSDSWYYSGKQDYERIKALSEKQVAELVKKPGNCKHYEKDGMACATCEDPETGDNSESCAYSSKPNDKKIAYLTKKSHNYKKPKLAETEEGENQDDESEDEEETAVNPQPTGPKPFKHNKSESEDADYGAYKLAGSNDDVEDYDEQKFGQLKAEPNGEKVVNDFEIIPQTQFQSKNLNQALTDFNTKDWSSCNKIMKGDMTCYYCKDQKNAVQEECMFVSASNPKSFKVERSESKKYDNTKKPTATTKKPNTALKRPIYVAAEQEPKSASIRADPVTANNRFARLRVGRPLMPTRATIKSTAEPLVTPTTNLNPNNHDDFSHSGSKKTIKRTVSYRKNIRDNDPYQPEESRAVHFESHVRHFEWAPIIFIDFVTIFFPFKLQSDEDQTFSHSIPEFSFNDPSPIPESSKTLK